MTAVVTLRNANSSVTGATSTTETNIVSACTGVSAQKVCCVCVAVQPRALQKLRDEVCGNVHQNTDGKARKDKQNTVQHTVFSTSTVSESFLFPKNRKNENGSTMDKNDAMDEIR